MAIDITRKSPGFYTNVDATRATGGVQLENRRALVVGQMLSTGTATADIPVVVVSVADAQEKFGRGSLLALMVEKYLKNNNNVELWCVPQIILSGTYATEDIVIGGAPTASGTISIYFDNKFISVPVVTSDTVTTIGDAIEGAINADGDLPFTAINTAGTVAITAQNYGTSANDIRLYYGGAFGTSAIPAGVTINGASTAGNIQLTSGATDPDIDDAIVNVPDEIFNYWICQYNDVTNVGKLVTELNRRNGELVQKFGGGFISTSGTFAQILSYGQAQNSEFLNILGNGEKAPTPSFLATAEFGGLASSSLASDPSLPLNTVEVVDFIPPAVENRLGDTEKESLLNAGITTYNVSRDGRALVQRAVTSYQENGAGAPDTAFLDVTTPFTLADMRESTINFLKTRYSRTKIVDDGNPLPAGQPITTPSLIKADLVGLATSWVSLGWMENINQFIEDLVVVRNISDPTRVDVTMRPDLVNGLQIQTVTIQFKL